MHTHRNQMSTASAFERTVCGDEPDRVINGLPLFHVAGATVMGLGALASGTEQILPTPQGFRDPAVIADHWRMVEHYRVTVTGGIPTSVASMLEVPVGDSDLSSLRFLVSGGSPVPAALCHNVRAQTGRELYPIYGMTECAGAISMPKTDAPARPGSAGYVGPQADIKIDERGEICVRGALVFPGYLGIDDTPVDADGWLHTGDLGHVEDNYLFITGRAKDLIIRSGNNIDPAVIEGCLDEHPAVTLSAAVGKPDAYAGELPVAFVQLRPDDNTTAEALRQFAIEHIDERPACPKQIFILKDMPLTAVGKIHKPTLREWACEQLVKETLAQAGLTLPDQLSLRVQKSGRMALHFEAERQDVSQCLEALAQQFEWQTSP